MQNRRAKSRRACHDAQAARIRSKLDCNSNASRTHTARGLEDRIMLRDVRSRRVNSAIALRKEINLRDLRIGHHVSVAVGYIAGNERNILAVCADIERILLEAKLICFSRGLMEILRNHLAVAIRYRAKLTRLIYDLPLGVSVTLHVAHALAFAIEE